jgi:sucrose-6-phosphate hydrolase SacC (GH32 family)
LHNGDCWYAAQVYSDIPASDGRCILVPWGRLPDSEIFRGMPFNQMMGLPVELTLRSTGSSTSLLVNPVRELQSLRQTTHVIRPEILMPGDNPLAGVLGDLIEIEAEISVGDAKEISFDLRGVPVIYDVAAQEILCRGSRAGLGPKEGKIELHIFVDRASVDIFGGNGTLYLPMAQRLSPENQNFKLTCSGGKAGIVSLTVHQLRSAWSSAQP